MKLIIASKNSKKLSELQRLMGAFAVVSPLPEHVGLPEETGDTFEANALLKARHACKVLKQAVVADDSGICVDALNGSPGVYSARFAGETASDADNRALMRHMLKEKGLKESKAHFMCVLALVLPNGEEHTFEGSCHGKIITSESGEEGFGYDSLFIPNGHTKTFAQMPFEQKGEISHRKKALDLLLHYVEKNV